MKQFVVAIDVHFEASEYTAAQEYADFIIKVIHQCENVTETNRERVEEDD